MVPLTPGMELPAAIYRHVTGYERRISRASASDYSAVGGKGFHLLLERASIFVWVMGAEP
jgi:hypothetical protein